MTKAGRRLIKAAKQARISVKRRVILPKKMSALIDIALKDLRKVEKTKGMIVNMADWLNPKAKIECYIENDIVNSTPVCTACAAGAVMAFTLDGRKSTRKYLNPENFKDNSDQLYAINALRLGQVGEAADCLGLCKTFDNNGLYTDEYMEYSDLNVAIPRYDHLNPSKFHKAMERLSAKLKKAGY